MPKNLNSQTDRILDKPKKPLCGRIIKTYDNTRKPCLRPEGHTGYCNPFSDSDAIPDTIRK